MDRYHIFDFQPALIFFVCLFFLAGCGIGTPLRTKSSFSYCFDGENTGLDTMLKLNGFFYIKNEVNKNLIIDKSNVGNFHPNFKFYENGFVHDNPYILLDLNKSKFGSWIDNFSGADFGRYILNGDTIKTQLVEPPGGQIQEIYEVWFVFIDKYNIRPVYWGDPDLVSNATVNAYLKNGPYRNEIFTFYPMERKINPEKTWIYNKRWFKCNKN
jgi:hypothetical protein